MCLATFSLLYSEHYVFIITIVTVNIVVSSAVLGSADTNRVDYSNNNGTLSYFWQFRKRWLTIVTYRWPVRTTGHSHLQRAHTIWNAMQSSMHWVWPICAHANNLNFRMLIWATIFFSSQPMNRIQISCQFTMNFDFTSSMNVFFNLKFSPVSLNDWIYKHKNHKIEGIPRLFEVWPQT